MPATEHEVDEELVRALLAQLPTSLAHVRDHPLRFVAEGWDNSVWRVGQDLAARVARRELAATLLENEARWLDVAAAPLVEHGVGVPRPVHLTPAGPLHPLPWLLTTWVPGEVLETVPMPVRVHAADALSRALPALHRRAPADAPHNPYRAPGLHQLPAPRPDVVGRAREALGAGAVAGLLAVHDEGARQPPWPGPQTWCHGDLHPLNLALSGEDLGVLDFGDVTAGDPAVDLGVLWTGFDRSQRAAAVARLAAHYDTHVWERARAWAARLLIGVAGNDARRWAGVLRHSLPQVLS